MHAERDGEADVHPPADRHDLGGVEARVGPHRELARGARSPHAPDRLAQEVGGTPGRVGPSLAQARHQDVAGAGGHREQGVIPADVGVPVVDGTFLLEAVRLADRRVEVDRERRIAGTGTGSPGPRQELPGDAVELADVAPAEVPQEGAPVDAALTVNPRTLSVPPARSAAASSMQSPPASAEATRVRSLSRPPARPGAWPRSR